LFVLRKNKATASSGFQILPLYATSGKEPVSRLEREPLGEEGRQEGLWTGGRSRMVSTGPLEAITQALLLSLSTMTFSGY